MNLIARVFAMCEGVRSGGRGRPLADLVRVLATFRRFLREGTPWRSLRASETQASGATLRRRLTEWARTDLLRQVHVTLVGLLRGGHPDLILDSCSVRAKRGGDLTGRNPTDRGKRGTKYHVAVDGNGVPVACAVTGANVPDTLLFQRLFREAFAVLVRLRTVFADKGYDAEANRDLCRHSGAEPCIHMRGQPHGSGLGQRRWPVERSLAWVLENKRLDRRYDRKGAIVEALLRGACIFTAVSKLIQEFIEETATQVRT
jgi:transposase